MKVPFFDYPRVFLDDKEKLLEIFEDVGRRGAFILQREVEEFEACLASYLGAGHAVGVANATDGLELALMAIGLGSGDEVICCSHTMVATAASIKLAGGVPIPVEIADDGLIDPDAVEAAISSRTVGIMPTQLNGRVCNMDRIMEIAEKNGLFVVEDAAQALGARYKGKCAGTFGKGSAISFFPAKVLGSLGDGGAVITNDYEIFDSVYQLHDHGRDINGETRSWGRNSRLDNLHAAILLHRIGGYSGVIERRRGIARIYQERLGELEQLHLPPFPQENSDYFDVYQNYEIQAEQRDELKAFLFSNGVGTLIQWGGKAIHQWEHLGFNLQLPRVERFFTRCIMLPMNTFVSDDDVHFVCDKINNFYVR